MPLKVRVGTFNCENLFARFRFRSNVKPPSTSKDRFTINDLAFEFLDEDEKALTAGVIAALDADVIALQEVEDFDVLKRFRNQHLKKLGYVHAILVDGNDPRFIDVAVLSRHPLARVRSHQELQYRGEPVFSRDCLEVDVDVQGRPLTLFVNHFKSMLDKKDKAGGRKNTRARRALQARTAKRIVTDRFGESPGQAPFVVCGDFNDYLGAGQGTTDAIRTLVKWPEVENVLERLPAGERWTHFYETRKTPDDRAESYKQIDYLLPSASLARATAASPVVVRLGLCRNAARYSGERLAAVGASRPAASDHCALGMDLVLD